MAVLKDPRPQRSLQPLAQDARLLSRHSAETAFNSSDRVTGHPATDVVNQLACLTGWCAYDITPLKSQVMHQLAQHQQRGGRIT